MASTEYVVRDDDRYTVVVGWDDDLESFFARVFSRVSSDGTPLHELGTRPHEIRALSLLLEGVQGFATLDGNTVSALRHDAAALL
jgi:hypothetical protein